LAVIGLCLVLMIGMLLPGSSDAQLRPGTKRAVADGEEFTIKGVITARNGEMFTLRDITRVDVVVLLTDTTKIRTARKGIFRGHDPFEATVLEPGLIVEVEGVGNAAGQVVAKEVQFTEADLKAAITAAVRTAPVAQKTDQALKGVAANEERIGMTDKKLEQTSQEVVDTNKRISSLDEYDLVNTVSILFQTNSPKLTDEGKTQLDGLAAKAPSAKNYMVEIQGFADPRGDFQKNLDLSRARARSVVEYLTVKHNVPLRRITIPMGYGETKAAGDPKSTESLAQDRRVDVRILVNKGLNK
jgi:OmpA-OmpF porin, OOP family